MQQHRAKGIVPRQREAVAQADLAARADFLVTNILKNGPNAVRAAKAMIPRIAAASPSARVKMTVDTLVKLRSSPEGQEGLTAFLEKRSAAWVPKP